MAWPNCSRRFVRMFKSSRISQSMAPRRAALAVLGALAINALVFSPLGDQGFIAIALLGPPLSGFVAGVRGKDMGLVAAAWALSGLSWLVGDWIVNAEDRAFHLVLTVLMVALVWAGAQLARLLLALARKLADRRVVAGR
jgi:apolipoprotein N-acyltransferase